MQAMGIRASNSAFIDYPIALQSFGNAASVALALCTLVENLLIMPLSLSLALAEPHDRAPGRSVLLQSLHGLIKNPMVIGMSAGIIFSALDVHLPAFATTAIGLVASAASLGALFVIGGSLPRSARLRQSWRLSRCCMGCRGGLTLHLAHRFTRNFTNSFCVK